MSYYTYEHPLSDFCRKLKEREAIYLLDDGQAPPLYTKGESYPWGTMHSTEALEPSDLRYWKSSAVSTVTSCLHSSYDSHGQILLSWRSLRLIMMMLRILRHEGGLLIIWILHICVEGVRYVRTVLPQVLQAISEQSNAHRPDAQVIGMLEKKVGEDAFRSLLERIVSAACESGSKGMPIHSLIEKVIISCIDQSMPAPAFRDSKGKWITFQLSDIKHSHALSCSGA